MPSLRRVVRRLVGRPRRTAVGAVVLGLLGLHPGPCARAADADPAPARAGPRVDVSKPYAGLRFERDFAEALLRAAKEGRPVYLCENGRVEEGEGGTTALWRAYQAADLGAATAGFVVFVANPTAHGTVAAGGEEVCERYGCGTCAAHQAASAYVVARFSADGTLISPSHYLLDADGDVVYRGDYMESAVTSRDLVAWFVRLSPRLALRAVWGAREARLEALGKAPSAQALKELCAAWAASGDPWAPAGLVAAADQEDDPARREALWDAVGALGAPVRPLIFDALDAAASDPDLDPAATTRLLRVARACDPVLFAWAAARAALRSRADGDGLRKVAADVPGHAALPPAARAHLLEAVLCLVGEDADLHARFEAVGREAGLPATRLAWAAARRGERVPLDLVAAGPDERRRAVLSLSPDDVRRARSVLKGLLLDEVEEVRVAAAVALLRGQDASGADLLLAAVEDPVEGPEVRHALTRLAGEDRGDSAGAWEAFVRAGGVR